MAGDPAISAATAVPENQNRVESAETEAVEFSVLEEAQPSPYSSPSQNERILLSLLSSSFWTLHSPVRTPKPYQPNYSSPYDWLPPTGHESYGQVHSKISTFLPQE